MDIKYRPVATALLAAILFGINTPFSKILVRSIDPLFLASLLYLGAGAGMGVLFALNRMAGHRRAEASLTKKEMPLIMMMILLDIAAPIFLVTGISMTNAGTAALLGNFEIAATALIAMLLFREAIGRRLWIAITLIIFASILLTAPGLSGIGLDARQQPFGALLVLLASVCWGFENNCTRNLSIRDPLQIVIIKGFGSGAGALGIAVAFGKMSGDAFHIAAALALGFVSYGLSIFFYVSAQRELGAARTGAYYAAAPFIGVAASWALLREPFSMTFIIALGVMLLGSYFAVSEKHAHEHAHTKEAHEHKHRHDDGHHDHEHDFQVIGEHSHEHIHEPVVHSHEHLPEIHHRHTHS